ncbi:hypothetical protein B0H63DRAFT_521307 [Podospora didyma]|uniref:Uncharacterized protein n=1 Tax=Podospora didyma TaxID=330526 RepID=A0AAE0NTB4_9PEZI|nr:hypothetical protein B0H63DRAFT_521307 [Podospora didyma]
MSPRQYFGRERLQAVYNPTYLGLSSSFQLLREATHCDSIPEVESTISGPSVPAGHGSQTLDPTVASYVSPISLPAITSTSSSSDLAEAAEDTDLSESTQAIDLVLIDPALLEPRNWTQLLLAEDHVSQPSTPYKSHKNDSNPTLSPSDVAEAAEDTASRKYPRPIDPALIDPALFEAPNWTQPLLAEDHVSQSSAPYEPHKRDSNLALSEKGDQQLPISPPWQFGDDLQSQPLSQDYVVQNDESSVEEKTDDAKYSYPEPPTPWIPEPTAPPPEPTTILLEPSDLPEPSTSQYSGTRRRPRPPTPHPVHRSEDSIEEEDPAWVISWTDETLPTDNNGPCNTQAQKWEEFIAQEQREDPGWINWWLREEGLNALLECENSMFAALIGKSREDFETGWAKSDLRAHKFSPGRQRCKGNFAAGLRRLWKASSDWPYFLHNRVKEGNGGKDQRRAPPAPDGAKPHDPANPTPLRTVTLPDSTEEYVPPAWAGLGCSWSEDELEAMYLAVDTARPAEPPAALPVDISAAVDTALADGPALPADAAVLLVDAAVDTIANPSDGCLDSGKTCSDGGEASVVNQDASANDCDAVMNDDNTSIGSGEVCTGGYIAFGGAPFAFDLSDDSYESACARMKALVEVHRKRKRELEQDKEPASKMAREDSAIVSLDGTNDGAPPPTYRQRQRARAQARRQNFVARVVNSSGLVLTGANLVPLFSRRDSSGSSGSVSFGDQTSVQSVDVSMSDQNSGQCGDVLMTESVDISMTDFHSGQGLSGDVTDEAANRYEDGEVRRYGAGESYRPFNRDRSPRAGPRSPRPGPRDRSPRPVRSPLRERVRTPLGGSDSYVPSRSPRRRSRSADRYRQQRERSREAENWRRGHRSRSRNRNPIRRPSPSPPRRSPPPRQRSPLPPRYASPPRRDDRGDRPRSPPPRRDFEVRDRRRSRSPFDRAPIRNRSPLRRTPPTGPRANSWRPRSRSPDRRERDDRISGLPSHRRPSPPPRDSVNTSALNSRSASGKSTPRPSPPRRGREERSRPHSPAPAPAEAQAPVQTPTPAPVQAPAPVPVVPVPAPVPTPARSPPRAANTPAPPPPVREPPKQPTQEANQTPVKSPPRGPAALRAPPTGPSATRNIAAPIASQNMPPNRQHPQVLNGHTRPDITSPTMPPSGPRGYVPPPRGGFAPRGGRGTWSSMPPRHMPNTSQSVSPTIPPPTGPSGIPTGPRAASTSSSTLASSPSVASKPFNPPTGPAAHTHNAPQRPTLAQSLIASMPPILPGGKIDPASVPLTTGVIKELEPHYKKCLEEEERVREELKIKQEKLRRSLKMWDKAERESRSFQLKSDLSEKSLQNLAGEGVGGAAF